MSEQIWLFSYGTLRQSNVQQAVFGRELESFEDALEAYELREVAITDPAVIRTSGTDYHPILTKGDSFSRVAGHALSLNAVDLDKADQYEVSDYVRVPVVLASGRKAFAYVQREEASNQAVGG